MSPLVVTTMLAEVALFGRIPFALTSIESYAQLLESLGFRVVTFAPKFVIELSKKLLAGLPGSDSLVVFSVALSPVSPASPSYATNPSVVRTGPDGGVVNPETGIVIGGDPDETVMKPSSTVRFRGGWVRSSYATTNVQPA